MSFLFLIGLSTAAMGQGQGSGPDWSYDTGYNPPASQRANQGNGAGPIGRAAESAPVFSGQAYDESDYRSDSGFGNFLGISGSDVGQSQGKD
ncbi:MAG: hypothetical protein GVY28_02440 [Alphaproteobacteria bacterium]|jgi:hypothetical protein|nr:hypothetical protein [Alphaproteobacteria bacterium]